MAISDSVQEAAFGLSRGGSLYNEIMSRNPVWVDEIQEKLEMELTKKYGDAPMKAPMSAVICEATKPSQASLESCELRNAFPVENFETAVRGFSNLEPLIKQFTTNLCTHINPCVHLIHW